MSERALHDEGSEIPPGLNGLSSIDARHLLKEVGPNRWVKPDRFARVREVVGLLLDPMAVMLIIAALVYFTLGETRDAVVLALALIPVLGVDVLLEARSRAALKKLARAAAPSADVVRERHVVSVPLEEVVPGDLLVLREGHVIAADGVVRWVANLAIDESSLTGESEPQPKREWPSTPGDAPLATLAAPRLRATPDQLCDAFQASPTLHPVYRRLLKLTLEELQVIEDHLGQLDQQMADLLAAHHDAVQRLAEVPGLGVDSAQQIIAEVGAAAATFPSPKHLASWMGACPGNEESAGVNYSHRCPKGNRQMRRVLNQAANAAVKARGTIFAVVYRRLVPRLGHAQAIGAITHRLCRLIWKILHERVRYEERGPSVSAEAKKVRARKMIRELRSLGYRVELPSATPSA